MSYQCERCGEIFDDPEYVTFCYEDEYGVSSMFPNRTYGEYAVCPNCGSEEIEEYCEPDEDDEEENEDEYLGNDVGCSEISGELYKEEQSGTVRHLGV